MGPADSSRTHHALGFADRLAVGLHRRDHVGAVAQIGDAAGSNNMIDYFERQMREHGDVAASSRWLPACSFLPDTAAALARALTAPPGLYQIDGNERHTMWQIASALSELHGRRWRVAETSEPYQDQRMIDPRLDTASISRRLPALQ